MVPYPDSDQHTAKKTSKSKGQAINYPLLPTIRQQVQIDRKPKLNCSIFCTALLISKNSDQRRSKTHAQWLWITYLEMKTPFEELQKNSQSWLLIRVMAPNNLFKAKACAESVVLMCRLHPYCWAPVVAGEELCVCLILDGALGQQTTLSYHYWFFQSDFQGATIMKMN